MKLLDPKRKAVFTLFLHHERLAFHQIEKLLGLRSNDVAYFLEQLMKDGVLLKRNGVYQLTQEAEKYVPYFVETSEHLSPLPVILIAYRVGEEVLIHKRVKKPYLGMWALLGGRIRIHESIEDASLRILREKYGLTVAFVRCNAVMHERHVVESVLHAFFLILVTVNGTWMKDTSARHLVNVDDLEKYEMIPSDR